MSYVKIIPIEFNHCDPAGIVFYPRYFEMINSVIENFCADVLGWSFARIVAEPGRGLPTASLHCDFRSPSRLGEKIPFTLKVAKIGRSSVGLRILAALEGQTRLEAELTLVWMERGRGAPWPAEIRDTLQAELKKDEAS